MRCCFIALTLVLWCGTASAQWVSSGGVGGNISNASVNGVITPTASPFLATGSGVWCRNDAAMTSGQAVLTCSTSAPFKASMVGYKCAVYGAGAAGADLRIATISAFTSSSQVTLDTNAGTTVSSNVAVCGADDSTALQNYFGTQNYVGPIDAQNFPQTTAASQQTYRIPPGTYVVAADTLISTFASHYHVICDGSIFVLLGTGPYFQWGDGGTHFTIDHTMDGCTFYGTSALNTEIIYANYADKDRYAQNKFYQLTNGTVWLQKGNGDGNFYAAANQMQNVNRGFQCSHRCDNSNLYANVFSNYGDRAVIMNDNNAENDANFVLEGNKCNGGSTSVACFDIGSMLSGTIHGNYYEAKGSGGPVGEVWTRLGFIAASGFNLTSIDIEGNTLTGHGAHAALESITNGVSDPTISNVAFKHNMITSFVDIVDDTKSNFQECDIGPNWSSGITGTPYINTGLGNGNMQVIENTSSIADPTFQAAIVNFNGLKIAGKVAKSANYTLTNHDTWVPFTGGAGGVTATLPASNGDGTVYIIEKDDNGAGAVTVATSGGNTIDGAATFSLPAQYDTVILGSRSSTSWHVLAKNVGAHP